MNNSIFLKTAIAAFSIILLFVVFGLIFAFRDNNAIKKINKLSSQNDSLKKANKVIYQKIESYNDTLRIYDASINQLNKDRYNLKIKISSINSKYNNLQLDYEKAKNHSDNFNSIELKSYFTDSLR
jgi:chromosome segregation ATPase